MKSDSQKVLSLSKKGKELIEHYKDMANHGYKREDGIYVKDTYESFELKKFKELIQPQFKYWKIKSVLDYGGGGSNWDRSDFSGEQSAKDFFNLEKVISYEPARNYHDIESCDCVVCFDVLEHVYLNDLNDVLTHIYSHALKFVIIQVACYEAQALLPTGENAHITVRPPIWWKGFIDSISIKFPDISTMLFCSTEYKHAQLFKIWNNAEYDNQNEYTVKFE